MEKEKFNKLLGALIAQLRNDHEMAQEEFGEMIGISRTYIGTIERGEKSISAYLLFKILKKFDVDLNDFFKTI